MSASFDLPNYLSRLPPFSELCESDRARIVCQGCSLLRLGRGEHLFEVGERCDAAMVVVTGHVKLFTVASHGSEKVVELVGPGQLLGETLVFNEQPHNLAAQTLTEALVLRIPKAAMTEQVARDSRFALKLLAGASQRIQGLWRDVESYCLHSALRRVIGYLLGEHNTACSSTLTISLPVSKAIVASRLSLTPEYFSRVLRELEEAGLISVDKRTIHIPDAHQLAHYPEAAS